MPQCLYGGLAMIVVAMVSAPSPSHAQFKVCNRASVGSIDVAFGLHRGRSGWESEGWFTIRRGRCATLVARPLRERHYYVYAESGDTVWDGDDDEEGASFCVRPGEVFKLNDASLSDEGDLACEKHGFVTKKFMHVDTDDNTDFTFNIGD